jgi:hypothetical protein
MDALLYPVQQLLELLSHIPGLKGLAGDGAKFIHEMRANLSLTEADPKKEKKKEREIIQPFSSTNLDPYPIQDFKKT